MAAERNLLNRTISSRHHRSLPLLVKGEFRCYLQKKKAPYLIDENKGEIHGNKLFGRRAILPGAWAHEDWISHRT